MKVRPFSEFYYYVTNDIYNFKWLFQIMMMSELAENALVYSLMPRRENYGFKNTVPFCLALGKEKLDI